MAACLVLGVFSPCLALTLDFNDLAHGQLVAADRYATLGVYLEVHGVNGPTVPVAFDTSIDPGDPAYKDNDLLGPPADTWDGGNLVGVPLNRALIVPQKDKDPDGDGFIEKPDANSAGGLMSIQFDRLMYSFGFDWANYNDPNVTIDFYRGGVDLGKTVAFGDLADPADPFYRAGVSIGRHYANRIDPITATELNEYLPGTSIFAFDEVRITLSGPGALANLEYQEVPEPGTLLTMGLGLAALAFGWRRRKSS